MFNKANSIKTETYVFCFLVYKHSLPFRGSEKNCDFRNKSNVSAVVCGKHAPLFRERKVVSLYWPALLEHFPSARPHPVPMVPSALIGYCNFWSVRRLGI